MTAQCHRQNYALSIDISVFGTWGHEDSSVGYIHMEICVGTEYTAPLNLYFRGLGDTGTAI